MELRVYMLIVQLVSVKGGENDQLGVRQEYIMSPWLFNVYMEGVIEEVNMGM